MDFLVLSRYEVESGEHIPQGVPHVVVSIGSPYDKQGRFGLLLKYPYPQARIPPNPNCKGILRLQFLDATGREFGHMFGIGYEEGELFNEQMARQVLKFIRGHKDKVNLIVCHCEAGVSRSAATAAALSKCFGQSDMEFYKGRFHPNPLVYRTILNVAQKMDIFTKFAVTA
jgi:hypothetical protein